jgi:regulator of sigma E protease
VTLAAGIPDPSQLLSIVKVVLGFGLVIFIHEFGHYLMARRNGVFVEKFAIGFDFFGAKLFTWHRGGTEYVIGAFPMGGYVKMKGQHDLPEEGGSSSAPDSFQAKSVWARTQIISAGVIANFLSAFVLCWFAFVIGYHSYPAEVGTLSYDTLEAGLRSGDQIIEVDGRPVASWEQLVLVYATREPGSKVPVTVIRDGEERRFSLTIHRDPALPINYPDFRGPVELRVGSYEVGSAADEAGIEPGDRLLSVDGHPIRTWSEFQSLIRHRPDRDIVVLVERDGEQLELVAHTESRSSDQAPKFRIDIEPKHDPIIDFVEAGSPAAKAGLLPGDRVVAVGQTSVRSWYGLWRAATFGFEEHAPVPLTIARGGSPTFEVALTPGLIPDWGMPTTALPALGIAGRPPEQLEIGHVGPALADTLQVGDVIVAIKGEVVLGKDETGKLLTEEWGIEGPLWRTLLVLQNKLVPTEMDAGSGGASATKVGVFNLTVERDGKRHSFDLVTAKAAHPIEIGFLGVAPLQREELIRLSPLAAIAPSLKAPFRILKDFVDGIRAMAMKRASTRLLAGPVGILQATYAYAEKSTGDLANFLALLSVNLAVVNFLPIPITDGGHFVFLMYEKVKGRRMDEELEARFQWAGLVFILMLFLFATFNDVGRIFGF